MMYKFPYSQERLAELTNKIVADAGVPLTLRQIFYPLEQKHGLVQPEYRRIDKVKDKAYKILSPRLVKAREYGLVPWESMIDKSRNIETVSAWTSLQDYLETIKHAYRRDLLQDQPIYLEVWCEKRVAINSITQRYQVPLVAGGGYRGKSNLYEAAQRFRDVEKPIKILYLGDFDPSGMDIERDLTNAFWNIWRLQVDVERILLTKDDTLRLPAKGPANQKDPRYAAYTKKWQTDEAWELDALDPKELLQRVETAIQDNLDGELLGKQQVLYENDKEKLAILMKNL